MMFVNGEVAGALNETTALVEEIVRGQVVEMILRSSKQAFRRGARSVQVEDLIFPIRHDRAKVSRLTTYLSWKDVRKNAKEADVAPVEATADPVVAEIPPVNEANAASQERLRAADERTRNMTREEYVHWSECRQASFTYRKVKRFRDWAGISHLTSSAPNDDIIDILGFLTFETVAILTEQVLKVKAEFDLAQQRAPKNDISFLNWQTFTPHKHHYLFDPPEEDRSPLGAIHVREAFRRLQRPPSKSKILRNFRGGIVHTSLRLI